jgi:hypothetical protein
MKKTVDKIPFYRLGWNKGYFTDLGYYMDYISALAQLHDRDSSSSK